MGIARKATFAFTKLIVDDEEAMAEYYSRVYGLNIIQRISGDLISEGEAFREVILGPDDSMSTESLIMFKFVDRHAPRDQEVILGFITEDLDALAARVVEHGGKHVDSITAEPEHGVRVLFTTDPEGRLSENVELIVPSSSDEAARCRPPVREQ